MELIQGDIEKINYRTPKYFLVKNSITTVKISFYGYLPIERFDQFNGVCERKANGELYLKSKPKITMSTNKSVIRFIFKNVLDKTGEGGNGKAVWREISEKMKYIEIESKGSIFDYLNNFSANYPNNKDQIMSKIFSPAQIYHFCKFWEKKRNMRALYLLGISKKEIKKSLYNTIELYQKLVENPYKVIEISMKKANEICDEIGLEIDHEVKKIGEIARYVYNKTLNSSFSSVKYNTLVKIFGDFSNFNEMEEYSLVKEGDDVFYKKVIDEEIYVCDKIYELSNNNELKEMYKPLDEEYINYYIQQNGINLSIDQKQALLDTFVSPVNIITGTAGTGKTTMLSVLISYFKYMGYPFMATSYTGKAVSRIEQVVGNCDNTSTIHRLIGKLSDFSGILIIDEATMVPLNLFSKIFLIMRGIKKLILVGDVNQLESIRYGKVFKDLIESKRVITSFLINSHRTVCDNSLDGIVKNANEILKHKNGDYHFIETNNFLMKTGDEISFIDNIKCLYKNVDRKDIKIITPYKQYVNYFNKNVQNFIKSDSDFITTEKGLDFHIGDIVMCLKNNYDINVFNGQEGIIESFELNEEGEKEVKIKLLHTQREILVPLNSESKNSKIQKREDDEYFDDILDEDEEEGGIEGEFCMNHFTLSYALTTDKSQGSEWDIIVIYFPVKENNSFLSKNRLYTSITRAKKLCICFGDLFLYRMVINNKSKEKGEKLKQRLEEKLTIKYEVQNLEDEMDIDLDDYDFDDDYYY